MMTMKFFAIHKRISFFAIVLMVSVLIITAYFRKNTALKTIPDNIPEDVYEFLISYLETCKNDPDKSVSYCHFEEESEREAYTRSYIEIIGYDVMDTYPLAENLCAFNVHMEREDAEYSRDYYFFVGEIENQMYLMNNVYNIPEEMRSVIDEKDFFIFTYSGTLIPSTSIILSGCSGKDTNTFEDVPEEFTQCLQNALDALKESGAASVQYSYFPNEQLRDAREGAAGNLISYTIDSAKEINENLYVYEVSIEVAEDPGVFETYYKFVGNIDGQILYIGHPNWVPESISKDYDSADFQNPTSENTLPSDAIIFE